MQDGRRDELDDGREQVEDGGDEVALSDLELTGLDIFGDGLLDRLHERGVVGCRADGLGQGRLKRLEQERRLLLVRELGRDVRSELGQGVFQRQGRRGSGRHAV